MPIQPFRGFLPSLDAQPILRLSTVYPTSRGEDKLGSGVLSARHLQSMEAELARYQDITPAEMTPAQRRVHDLIVAGRRGRFGGPFQLLIRAPEICEHAAKLGEHLRWGTSLPDRLSELAIITTAQFWRAQYEWYAHAPLAEKAGVPAAAVEAIRHGGTPSFEQQDEALVYRLCTELFKTRRLSDPTFAEAVTTLGETGLIEVIAIIGYYTLIGNTLNAFQIAVPEGTAPPFSEEPR